MSKKLEFTHKDYVKYDSMRIYIENATLELKKEDYTIINEFEKTKNYDCIIKKQWLIYYK